MNYHYPKGIVVLRQAYKFKESVKGSCVIQTHPVLSEKLSEDKQLRVKELLDELCDLLRDEIGDVEEL